MKHVKRMKHRKMEPQAPKGNQVYVTERKESPESDAMPASAHWLTVTQVPGEGKYVVTNFVEYTSMPPEGLPGPYIIGNSFITARSDEEASAKADIMLDKWMDDNASWDKWSSERIARRKHQLDLRYSCKDTGLTGFSMAKLASTEIGLEQRIGGMGGFMDESVADIRGDCGDVFGTTYPKVCDRVSAHLEAHPECKKVYERLKASELAHMAEDLK